MRFNEAINVADIKQQESIQAKLNKLGNEDKLSFLTSDVETHPVTGIEIRKKNTPDEDPADIVIHNDSIVQNLKSTDIKNEMKMLFDYRPTENLSPIMIYSNKDQLNFEKLRAYNTIEIEADETKAETKKRLIKNNNDKDLLIITTYNDGRTEVVPANSLDAEIFSTLMTVCEDIYKPRPAQVNSMTSAVKTPTLSITDSNRSFNPLDNIQDLNLKNVEKSANPNGSVDFKDGSDQVLLTIDKQGIHASIDGDSATKDAKIQAFVEAAKYYVDNQDVLAYEVDCTDEEMLLKATTAMIAQGIPVKITNPEREQRIVAGLDDKYRASYNENLETVEKKLTAPSGPGA